MNGDRKVILGRLRKENTSVTAKKFEDFCGGESVQNMFLKDEDI